MKKNHLVNNYLVRVNKIKKYLKNKIRNLTSKVNLLHKIKKQLNNTSSKQIRK